MTPSVVEVETVETGPDPTALWWLFVVLGVISLIVGILLVFKPSNSLSTLAVIFGIFLLLDGIGALILSFRQHEGSRALLAIVGVLGMVFGIVLIRHPSGAVTAIGLLIGLWLVAAGVVRLVWAIMEPGARLLRIGLAALEIIVGVVVVSEPHIGYATLAILTGIWLILNAIGLVGLGLALRGVKSEEATA